MTSFCTRRAHELVTNVPPRKICAVASEIEAADFGISRGEGMEDTIRDLAADQSFVTSCSEKGTKVRSQRGLILESHPCTHLPDADIFKVAHKKKHQIRRRDLLFLGYQTPIWKANAHRKTKSSTFYRCTIQKVALHCSVF